MRRPCLYRLSAGLAAITAMMLPTASPAYLYWVRPAITGTPVVGDEPGVALPLPGAKPGEIAANLLWAMRAGLNVAALQCQFAPGLMTVHYYNDILKYHAAELEAARAALAGYFKRTAGKKADTLFDEYTTRTYNGFSTFHAQLGFCETAASIDREAMARPRGQLALTAQTRMREFRNSLVPVGEAGLRFDPGTLTAVEMPSFDASCYDKKDRLIDCETGRRIKPPKA